MDNILKNTIEQLELSLKHPGHPDQQVHDPTGKGGGGNSSGSLLKLEKKDIIFRESPPINGYKVCERISKGTLIVPDINDQTTAENSQTIENLFLGIPISPIISVGEYFGNMDIKIGYKPLLSLRDFAAGKFQLEGLEFYHELNGLDYNTLPRPYQRRLEAYNFQILTLDKTSPEAINAVIKKYNR